MLKKAITTCCIVLAISLCTSAAHAQWAIHALAGKIESLSASAKTITLDTNDGTPANFHMPQKAKLDMNFDKEVRDGTIPVDKFTGAQGQVIVFFFGDGVVRTVVAVQSVGAGPFQKLTGTVLKYDKHDRTLTLQTEAGEQAFVISDKTIVDTPDGVVPGHKFTAERGDHLRLLAASNNGQPQTLLVRFDGNPTH
jgi:hypothetical protein